MIALQHPFVLREVRDPDDEARIVFHALEVRGYDYLMKPDQKPTLLAVFDGTVTGWREANGLVNAMNAEWAAKTNPRNQDEL